MNVAIRKLSEKNRTLMIYMHTAYCIMKEELPYTLLFYSMNGHCYYRLHSSAYIWHLRIRASSLQFRASKINWHLPEWTSWSKN
jgi:hypothetical protein